MSVFSENPVLMKEVRSRLRARRQSRSGKVAALLVTSAIVLVLYYFGVRAIVRSSGNGAMDIYGLFVVGIELTLVLFLVPSLAAGAITQEREQQTWNALLLSRLTAGQIVSGKFLAALLPVFIILGLLLPLNLLAAAYAAMPLRVVLLSHGLLYATALFLTALSLFFSWAFRRTYVATAASFASVAFLVIGTYILFAMWALSRSGSTVQDSAFPPMWLNPYRAMVWVVDPNDRQLGPPTFDLMFCLAATVVCCAVVTRRLGRGPKEMEQ
jgi:ABC-type transport system involved in multi-copper enzyme maturation permease subunit